MWYFEQDGEQHGPVPDGELSQLMQAGTVRPETLVWRDGQAGWQPAIEVVPQRLRPDANGSPPPLPEEDGAEANTSTQVGDQPMPQPNWSYGSEEDGWPAHHPYTFGDSVRNVFNNYANFSGRARRREYWWFALFAFISGLATATLDGFLFPGNDVSPINSLLTLGLIIPNFAVGARRLHDIGKSGWWQLILLIPLIGVLVLIYWNIQKSDPGPNEHGPE